MSREQPDRRFAKRFASFKQIVDVVEKQSGERWAAVGHRRGNKIRNLVLYLARQRCGMTLREIGDCAGGLDYKMVGKVVRGYAELVCLNKEMQAITQKCLDVLAISET